MRGVTHRRIQPVHEDERRALIEIFNGEFNAWQLKVLKVKSDSIMGNHYHPYGQFFYLLTGQDTEYTFVDIHSQERHIITMSAGDLIMIDREIAHMAFQRAGNIMIEGNEKAYTSAAVDDLRYVIQ